MHLIGIYRPTDLMRSRKPIRTKLSRWLTCSSPSMHHQLYHITITVVITRIIKKLSKYIVIIIITCCSGGRDSSVGIATSYGMDGPGARFSVPVQTGPGAHPASCTMGNGSFPGVKRPGRGADHPPPSSVPKS